MTLITVQDGKPVLRDGKVGTEQACCCQNECECQCICPGFALTPLIWGPSPYGPIYESLPDAEAQAEAILGVILQCQTDVLGGSTGDFTIQQRDCEGGGSRVELVDDPGHPLWSGSASYWVFYPELIATCCGEIAYPGTLQWSFSATENQFNFSAAYECNETCTPTSDYPAPFTGTFPACTPEIGGQSAYHPAICNAVSYGACVEGECNPLP